MTTLATLEHGGGNGTMVLPEAPVRYRYTLPEIMEMAEWVAASGLFCNCKSPQQVATLMLLCDYKGLHPMAIMERYHLIPTPNGVQATMRADCMQADFQARGGVVEIVRDDAEEARAIFSHPKYHPKPIERVLTYQDCVQRGITKGREGEKKNWRESRAAMLWARLVTSSIRLIYPGVVAGIYSPEELEDSEERPKLAASTVAALEAQREPKPELPLADEPVFGFVGTGDTRNYRSVAIDATGACNAEVKRRLDEALGDEAGPQALKEWTVENVASAAWLFHQATQAGLLSCDRPKNYGESVKVLDGLYKAHRAWVRKELTGFFTAHLEKLDTEIAARVARMNPAPSGDGELDLDDDARMASGPNES